MILIVLDRVARDPLSPGPLSPEVVQMIFFVLPRVAGNALSCGSCFE